MVEYKVRHEFEVFPDRLDILPSAERLIDRGVVQTENPSSDVQEKRQDVDPRNVIGEVLATELVKNAQWLIALGQYGVSVCNKRNISLIPKRRFGITRAVGFFCGPYRIAQALAEQFDFTLASAFSPKVSLHLPLTVERLSEVLNF